MVRDVGLRDCKKWWGGKRRVWYGIDKAFSREATLELALLAS